MVLVESIQKKKFSSPAGQAGSLRLSFRRLLARMVCRHSGGFILGQTGSQKLSELPIRKPRVSDDGLERIGIESPVTRDRDAVKVIGHAGVFTLVNDLETDLLKGADDLFRRDVRKEQLNGHHGCFSRVGFFLDHGQIGADRIADICQRFLQRVALADASWKGRALDTKTVSAFLHDYEVFHGVSV